MRNFWVLLFLSVPILGTGLFIAAAASSKYWLPEPISTISERIDHLFYVILWITGIFFVVTEVLLAYALFKATPTGGKKAVYTHGSNKLEVAWTLGTAVILLFIAFYQMPAWLDAKVNRPSAEAGPKAPKQRDALVAGSQFLWEIHYPMWDEQANKQGGLNTRSPDQSRSFKLVNELHVPAGRMFVLDLTTRDVIHSFSLPNARVKQDALPGHLIPVWFEMDAAKLLEPRLKEFEAGGRKFEAYHYEWYCAELCGWGHFRMRGRLIVHKDAKDYDEWLKAMTREIKSPKPGK